MGQINLRRAACRELLKFKLRGGTAMAGYHTNNLKWLHEYLMEAVHRNMCTRANCTTCAAGPFREGLLKALGRADRGNVFEYTPDEVIAIAQGLVQVQPVGNAKFTEAVRSVIMIIWYANGRARQKQIEEIIQGSWAGQVLESMKAHEEALYKARVKASEFQSPEAVRERREEKKRIKREKHAVRLALKADRDRIYG